MDFDIASDKPSEGVFVIALSGEVDLYTAPEFKQQLIDAVAEGAKHVVVDLSKTTFIDSTTLGVLVGGVRRLRERPQHHQDLRDHRPRPGVYDRGEPRRGAGSPVVQLARPSRRRLAGSATERVEAPDGTEAELRVERLRPVILVGHQPDQVVT
jgi:anti-anti-sigma factor